MLPKGEIARRKRTEIYRGFELVLSNGDIIKLPFLGVGKSSAEMWKLLDEFGKAAQNANMQKMVDTAYKMFCIHVKKYYNVTDDELDDLIEVPELFKFVVKVQGVNELNEIAQNLTTK